LNAFGPNHTWPSAYPIEIFELVETSIPEGWIIQFGDINSPFKCLLKIGFPEWINDDTLYERLIEDDPSAIAIYDHWRKAQ
jgi:hypothetical protein